MQIGTRIPLRFAQAVLKTGVRLRYAEQGDAQGTPVILLHGYSDSWFSFSRILPLLSPRYRVYAFDMRGHGESDKPAQGYAIADLAADIVSFIEANALRGVVMVGHSLGSFVAQQVVADAPQHVDRLVLIDSATVPRAIIGLDGLDSAVRELTDPVPVAFIRDFQESTVHQPVPVGFMDRVVTESTALPVRVWQAVMDGMLLYERPRPLMGNTTPTLLLWGDRDAFMSRAEQDALMGCFPNAMLQVYAETGHTPHWERPGEVVRDMESFIEAAHRAGRPSFGRAADVPVT